MPGVAAVCPACGVPVVPGYVRCPKCHKALPKLRAATGVAAEGGTAVERGKSPLVVIAIGLVVLGAIGAVALHGRGGRAATAAPAPGSAAPVEAAPAPSTDTGAAVAAAPAARAPAGPDASAVAADLERSLKRQRLWSTVDVIGSTVDVRGSSCADPAMTAALDGAARAFKAAGLTKLRCLEQSGHVVVDRDL